MTTENTAQPAPIQSAELAEFDLAKALRKAYNFGQTYWQQADSESYSQQAKSNETADKFAAFVDETCAALTADASEDTPAPAANLDQIALDTAAKILPIYFEPMSGVQLKAKIQCVVRQAIDASRPPSGPDWKDAYLNMKAFAESHGLDTVAYGPNGGPINKVRIPVLRSTLESISEAMNHMGDALNEIDAVEAGDEKVFPAFDLISELLAKPAPAARPAPVAATPAPIPVWELFADGWDGVDELDPDWMQTLPQGTRLYYIGPAAAPAAPTSPPVTPKHIEQIKDILLWPVTEDDARTARDMLQSLHFDLSMAEQDPAPAAPIAEVTAIPTRGGDVEPNAYDHLREQYESIFKSPSALASWRRKQTMTGDIADEYIEMRVQFGWMAFQAGNRIGARAEHAKPELAAPVYKHHDDGKVELMNPMSPREWASGGQANPAENWVAHNPQELDEMLSRIPEAAHAKLAEGAFIDSTEVFKTTTDSFNRGWNAGYRAGQQAGAVDCDRAKEGENG